MSDTAPPDRPPDDSARQHHLSMIQGIVDRLAGNSAQMKNWTVAILAALLLFSQAAADGEDRVFAGIAMLVLTLVFWWLGGYYLKKERQFRHLYDKVRQIDPAQIDYSMDVLEFEKRDNCRYFRLLSSPSLSLFYATLALLCVVYIVLSIVLS